MQRSIGQLRSITATPSQLSNFHTADDRDSPSTEASRQTSGSELAAITSPFTETSELVSASFQPTASTLTTLEAGSYAVHVQPNQAATRQLVSGISPTPDHDLVFQGGKTIANLKFADLYLGGSQAWNSSDMKAIDNAIAAAMSDQQLNSVLSQYFPNQSVSSQFLGSAVLSGAIPTATSGITVASQSYIENRLQALAQQGSLKNFDLNSTVFDFVLPRGTVLTQGNDNSLNGLGGFHGSIHLQQANGTQQSIYYAVSTYSEHMANGNDNGITAFNQPWENIVATLYHELNEARTDPDVEDAIKTNNNRFLGWMSKQGEEIGDFPVDEAFGSKAPGLVLREVPLANGQGTVPIQLLYSNAVHGPELPGAVNVAPPNPKNHNVFAGTETTILQYPNVYGQPQAPQTFRTTVLADFSNPITAGGLTESSAFNLHIAPADNQNLQSPGAISIWSAAAYSLNGGLTSTLAQYWKIDWTDTAHTHFQGTLVDNRTAEAQAYNLLNSPYEVAPYVVLGAYPYAIAQGTKITGVFSAREIDIEVIGNTTDLAHPFKTDIVLTQPV